MADWAMADETAKRETVPAKAFRIVAAELCPTCFGLRERPNLHVPTPGLGQTICRHPFHPELSLADVRIGEGGGHAPASGAERAAAFFAKHFVAAGIDPRSGGLSPAEFEASVLAQHDFAEPWAVELGNAEMSTEIWDKDGPLLDMSSCGFAADSESPADERTLTEQRYARRIVACVNFFAGVATEVIEGRTMAAVSITKGEPR